MQSPELNRLPWPALPQSPAELYLELIKRVLTGLLRPQPYKALAAPAKPDIAAAITNLRAMLPDTDLELVQKANYNLEARTGGVEWIPDGETMVGLLRLDNVHECIRTVINDGIPGDFIETGVWRGGTCIFARACFAAYGDQTRRVWVADSFRGLPPPDPEKYPADAGDPHSTFTELAISRQQVQENFERYGLMDNRVQFLEGWFKDTLPAAPINQLAVLRLDGDMYESTMDALTALYPKLTTGGFAIIDDYLWHKPCAQAVEDYRTAHNITTPITKIDQAGVYWRK